MKIADESPESRVILYRDTADTLRRVAKQIHSDEAAINKLLCLADQWDGLAESVEKGRF